MKASMEGVALRTLKAENERLRDTQLKFGALQHQFMSENERLRAALELIAGIEPGAGNALRAPLRSDYATALDVVQRVAREALGSAANGSATRSGEST